MAYHGVLRRPIPTDPTKPQRGGVRAQRLAASGERKRKVRDQPGGVIDPAAGGAVRRQPTCIHEAADHGPCGGRGVSVHALDAARDQGAERRRQDDGPPVGGLASALQSLQDHDDVVQRRLVELPATPQGIHVQLDVPVDPLGRIVVLGIPGQAHGVTDASEVVGAICRERRLDTDELRGADHPVHVHESGQPSGPSIAIEPRVDGHQVEVEQAPPEPGGARPWRAATRRASPSWPGPRRRSAQGRTRLRP